RHHEQAFHDLLLDVFDVGVARREVGRDPRHDPLLVAPDHRDDGEVAGVARGGHDAARRARNSRPLPTSVSTATPCRQSGQLSSAQAGGGSAISADNAGPPTSAARPPPGWHRAAASTISPPAARTAATVSRSDPPVLTTSSTTTTRRPRTRPS